MAERLLAVTEHRNGLWPRQVEIGQTQSGIDVIRHFVSDKRLGQNRELIQKICPLHLRSARSTVT